MRVGEVAGLADQGKGKWELSDNRGVVADEVGTDSLESAIPEPDVGDLSSGIPGHDDVGDLHGRPFPDIESAAAVGGRIAGDGGMGEGGWTGQIETGSHRRRVVREGAVDGEQGSTGCEVDSAAEDTRGVPEDCGVEQYQPPVAAEPPPVANYISAGDFDPAEAHGAVGADRHHAGGGGRPESDPVAQGRAIDHEGLRTRDSQLAGKLHDFSIEPGPEHDASIRSCVLDC